MSICVAYFMDWVWTACCCRAMSRKEYQRAWVANKRKALRLMKSSATSTELLQCSNLSGTDSNPIFCELGLEFELESSGLELVGLVCSGVEF